MISTHSCIDLKTNNILNEKDYIGIEKNLNQVISKLQKKGYLVETCVEIILSKLFIISNLIEELKEVNIITDDTDKNNLLKAIDKVDYQCLSIIFENEYQFKNIPKGFKLSKNHLVCFISVLKNRDTVEFKNLIELDHELSEIFKNLNDWADSLPKMNI
ncbi:MAG: hypothetical protein ACI33S_02835 [Bacilli bacterium]